jgi:hypothetical protein
VALNLRQCGSVAAILLLAGACRRFELCNGSAGAPCAPEAESDGGGGAGSGASDAPDACGRRFRNCDQTPLNGCETDTLSDVQHCGRCGNPCAGVCSNSRCIPFSPLFSGRDQSQGLRVTPEFIYFVVRSDERSSLLRISSDDGSLTHLAESAVRGISGLAVSSSRVYMAADTKLFSVSVRGGDWELENEALSPTLLTSAGPGVALVSFGEVSIRADDSGGWRTLPGIRRANGISGSPRRLAIAEYDDSAEHDPLYTVTVRELSDTTVAMRAASGHGRVLALYLDDREAESTLYYSVAAELGPRPRAAILYAVEEGGEPKELASLAADSEWAIVHGFHAPFFWDTGVIFNYYTNAGSGLRFTAVGRSFTAEWPTAYNLFRLTSSGAQLFFCHGPEPENELLTVDVDAMLAAAITPAE